MELTGPVVVELQHPQHGRTDARTDQRTDGRMGGTTNGGHFDGLVQERRNSSALAMELRLSCTNPLIFKFPLIFLRKDMVNHIYY